LIDASFVKFIITHMELLAAIKISKALKGATSKIHLAMDEVGYPQRVIITSGTVNDCTKADELTFGYQGILKFHKNSETPKEKPKGGQLTSEEKAANKLLASERMLVENTIAKVKVFKITSSKYRNRRKRFGLRMSLVWYRKL